MEMLPQDRLFVLHLKGALLVTGLAAETDQDFPKDFLAQRKSRAPQLFPWLGLGAENLLERLLFQSGGLDATITFL